MSTTTNHVIDEATYTELQDIMADEFAELVDFFRKDAVASLDSLKQCVPAADAAQTGSICHKLKSSSKLIGAWNMAELARLLEEFKDNHDQVLASELLLKLEAEYAQVAQWLDDHQPISA